MMSTIKYLIFLLPFLVFSQIEGKVIKVKDGDTIVILDGQNEQHTIRVADIDCPEKSQPFGKRAKWFVSNLIFGKYVYVEKKTIDRYGRVVGYVLFDGKNVSEELLKNGLAWHYVKYSNSVTFQELENVARLNKEGLWNHPGYIAPWSWRKNKRR